jgi:cellulose synthase/poly-beta-1,6-N-acetylglucosamine synthase-like glycosyltransferase
MTWMQKGSSYVQELFYRMVQVNRDTWGASICVGTNAIYRRSSLERRGGTYPIAYSEDLHTGWQALADGYRVRYIPLNLAGGSCPETMSAYFVQQLRWCTGSTSLLMSYKFWSTPMPVMQRLCYMSGMLYYVATAASVFFTPLPALYVVWFSPEHVFWYNYLFSIPSFLFGTVVLAMWGQHRFGAYVLTARVVAYYAHFYALLDKFRGSMVQWVPTGDVKSIKAVSRYQDFKHLMFWWVGGTTAVGLAGAFKHMSSIGDWNFYPMIFFTLFHYYASMRAFKEEA